MSPKCVPTMVFLCVFCSSAMFVVAMEGEGIASRYFRLGRGLPREGAGAKKFGMPLETREIKLFWRDIPGFCRDIPVVPEKCEKKGLCSILVPYWMLLLCHVVSGKPLRRGIRTDNLYLQGLQKPRPSREQNKQSRKFEKNGKNKWKLPFGSLYFRHCCLFVFNFLNFSRLFYIL